MMMEYTQQQVRSWRSLGGGQLIQALHRMCTVVEEVFIANRKSASTVVLRLF